MMHHEFIELSGENYNEITGEYYMNFIEPVYQMSPNDMFKDKKDFINWWKKNKKMCEWMSSILRSDERIKLLEKIEELELKIAFTPDAIVREIRWKFFEHYEERKQDAISRGIIKQ